MFNHEDKSHQEASDFVDSLSEKIIDAAWTAGFFILACVEGFPEFLIPFWDKEVKSWKDWLHKLKVFVASEGLSFDKGKADMKVVMDLIGRPAGEDSIAYRNGSVKSKLIN